VGGTAGDIGKKHRPNLVQNEKPSVLTLEPFLTGSIPDVTKHDQIAQTRWFFKQIRHFKVNRLNRETGTYLEAPATVQLKPHSRKAKRCQLSGDASRPPLGGRANPR